MRIFIDIHICIDDYKCRENISCPFSLEKVEMNACKTKPVYNNVQLFGDNLTTPYL